MPPFLPRKRMNSPPPANQTATPAKKQKVASAKDANSKRVQERHRQEVIDLGSSSDSSLSDVDSDEFEEFAHKINGLKPAVLNHQDEEPDEDEDVEWEDAAAAATPQEPEQKPERAPLADGPIEITFRKDDFEIDYGTAAGAAAGKKGPSKREKEFRVRAHQMHVQYLLWHNFVRNRWVCDRTVQQTLVRQLPAQIRKEVDKWKRSSGLSVPESEVKSSSATKKKRGKQKAVDPRQGRDWTRSNQRLEPGRADMSHGDPLISLLKVLSAYWKKRFAITAPGLRKRGYGTKQQLKQDIYSFRNDDHDPELHGERIRNLAEFRTLAEKCEGSRDLGAILFTALLRGLGIESRLVASLQPTGYGFTKAEQMTPRKPVKAILQDSSSSDSTDDEDSKSISEIARENTKQKTAKRPQIRNSAGNASAPIDLDTETDGRDPAEDDSVVDVTPSLPKKRPQLYDRDIPNPIYWTEAISPITNKVLPVSPLVLPNAVATTPEILLSFEPRGAKAEKAKVVMAYVIAYCTDGSAKDVTVRYLKKHIFPGKTKGFRFPVEKIPVYNKYGKIKRYEDYDWFKTAISGYIRPDVMRTPVDDIEDATDLVAQEPEKKAVDESIDTLQSLKASADFVLERFLRREEALRPGSKPVRYFTSGKGEKLKNEPVYKRSDVERCLTAESWHKEGRKPRTGETPLKLVPVRAVTLTRKREAEEHERMTGEKQMQGLYSWDQTEYIVPPPIRDGVIPKNSYGNIDCFVPSMVPRGAVHVPLRGTVRICKKLEIDFAEAVTGFEFGHKRAVPVCQGVVVATENEGIVREAWRTWNEEQRKKEETKMEKLVLDLWRKFLMGLRIRERVQEEYGDANEPLTAFDKGGSREVPIDIDDDQSSHPTQHVTAGGEDDDMGGGFLLDDEEDQNGDLEMVHHDEAGRDADMEDMEIDDPGSLSPSPVRLPPVRRQRKPLVDEDDESDESDLSSALSDSSHTSNETPSDNEMDEYEEIRKNDKSSTATTTVRPHPTRRKPNTKTPSRIEINIPRRRNLLPDSKAPAADDDDNDLAQPSSDDSEVELSGHSEQDEEKDEYAPVKPRKASVPTAQRKTPRRRNLADTAASSPSPARKTRILRNSSRKANVLDNGNGDQQDEPVTPKRKRRNLRRDSTIVTSPYFAN